MELVEADQLPGMGQGRCGVDIGRVQAGSQRRQEFSIVQRKLRFAVGALVASLRGISAAVQFKVEFAVPGRQLISQVAFQLAEEILDLAKMDVRRGGKLPRFWISSSISRVGPPPPSPCPYDMSRGG